MESTRKTSFKRWPIDLIYYIASVLMPSILLFALYNQNRAQNDIIFMHVIIVSVMLALVSILLFLAFKVMTKSVEGSLLLSVTFWMAFWLFEMILDITRIFTTQTGPRRLLVLILLLLTIIIVISRRFKLLFERIRPAFNVLAVCIVVLFGINLIPSLQHEKALAMGRANRAEQEASGQVFYFKQDFRINSRNPTPDIYWLHMDGLMSMEVVEQFWGGCYEDIREELRNRGFEIYENAKVYGGFTWSSLLALLSPAFYDSFWGEQLADAKKMLRNDAAELLSGRLAHIGIDIAGHVMPFQYVELFNALLARGYEVDAGMLYGATKPGSHVYVKIERGVFEQEWRRFQKSDFPYLLSMVTPLSISFRYELEEDILLKEGVGMVEAMPQFTVINIMYAHMVHGAMAHIENPTPEVEYPMHLRYDLYPLVFEYAVERMIREIDEILERNPNAVIILQGDHGFHVESTQLHMIDMGYSLEQVLELVQSVFSAVRIPVEYGGLEAPISPLNITRELVNRFVGGGNYELLP